MTILVVRHGETDGNAARILQRPDVPLNQRGMRQAEQLAQRLFAHGFVHILCSDFLRARMTAVPLAACSGITIEESSLLQERNFGDLRGVPYVELTEDPFGPDFVPPNGEDWPRFHARVAEAFAFIVSRRRAVNGTLVVVTHGLVCRALVERHALVPPVHPGFIQRGNVRCYSGRVNDIHHRAAATHICSQWSDGRMAPRGRARSRRTGSTDRRGSHDEHHDP